MTTKIAVVMLLVLVFVLGVGTGGVVTETYEQQLSSCQLALVQAEELIELTGEAMQNLIDVNDSVASTLNNVYAIPAATQRISELTASTRRITEDVSVRIEPFKQNRDDCQEDRK